MEGGVEVAHGHDERVDGTAVLQVADKVDVQVVEGALCLVDAIEVEHALRRVLMGSVTSIDDGNVCHLCSIAGGSLDVVAHDDDVGIVGNHRDGVLQRLALCAAGNLGIGKSDDPGPKAVGSRLEAQACAGGRFEEEGGDHTSLE